MDRLESIERELIWRRCQLDPVYFVDKLCHYAHPEDGAVVGLRDVQKEIIEIWQGGEDTVTLKARQIGWSTVVAMFCLWMAMFHPSAPVIMLSQKQETARDLLAMSVYAYDRLPEWMRDRMPRTNKSIDSMKFANASSIKALPSKADPARGKTARFLVLDEWASYENPEDAWASVEPVTDVGGQIAALSTAKGAGGFFHRFWLQAKRGENGFRPLFYSWRARTERDDAWYEAQKLKMKEWQLHQEYPNTPEEAFISSGNTAFDVVKLQDSPISDEWRRGTLRGNDEYEIEFIENRDGDFWLLEEWDPNRTYVIGADIAEGIGGDYSCAQVLCVETGRQVARWHGYIDPDLFGDVLYRIGHYYGECLIGPERNAHGFATVIRLRRHLRYKRVFKEVVDYDRKKTRKTERFGWHTNIRTKPILVDDLNEALRDDAIFITHEATLAEAIAFKTTENGGWEGEPHDDEVMALGIAAQMLKHHPKTRRIKREFDEIIENSFEYWEMQLDAKNAANESTAHLRRVGRN